ncbi:hypothetical protein [Natronobacterium gregoryi]|uniref:Uncharacterized protein n=2 Tax=Natronobacterium gregoryi TaxID=44930 RepID=L0AH86_NATGS|nr:hypothetical protein [Natronobacterium gregoryi]AFZ72527.1 hypothetical protein Natgr_1308 [Natronobacterium gregoryi SP2]ELY74400.1 hypothetical protein C490_00495 [Natronobacterium gregoryi SP2]PLK21496.1 hypothetical protein CYV19_04185 [Natronobacterium gregoryi SP2]SFI76386.1 hypothetical protein SAMN05443661_10533 [Natronobacterium gregoryi]
MNPDLWLARKIKTLSYREASAVVVVALVAAVLYGRLGFAFFGPLAALLWIPFVGIATIWILFDSRERGFEYPSVVALTVAILLLTTLPGIAALATYYYYTRLR